MKCKYCGSNLNIDDETCSFCGKENTHAVQHRKDMKNYGDDYKKTKGLVFEKSGKKASLMAKGTIIAGLIIACFFILFLNSKAYEIRNRVEKVQVKRNLNTHKNNLDKLETDRDFFGFLSYYNKNQIRVSSDLSEFYIVARMTNEYLSIYDTTMEMLYPSEYSYRTLEKSAEFISDSIVSFYRWYESNDDDYYYSPERFSEPHMSAMKEMIDELETFIYVYMNVSEEDIEKFPELSSARIQMIIEGSVGHLED